jgi:CTP:molybdopterin cytidylyltransferase MocA
MNVGVLLAAGESRRMGRPKALVSAGRESFIAHGIRHLWRECDCVVVVLGAQAATIRRKTEAEFVRLVGEGAFRRELAHAHAHRGDELEVEFVTNRAWRRGMLSSAQVGLDEALRRKPDSVLVLPVDHPAVRPATVSALATVLAQALATCRNARERARFSYALIPRHRGRRGHPVALSPALAAAVARDRDAGDLSDAIRRSARLVGYLDVDDPGVVRNRNTPRD